VGDSAAHIVEAIGKAVVVFKRVGVSLKHEMFESKEKSITSDVNIPMPIWLLFVKNTANWD